MKKVILVKKDFINARIDRWVKRNICNVPQGFVEKSLRNKKITVNGQKIKDVEIWKISQNSPRIDNKAYKSVTTKSKLEDKPQYGKNKNKLKKPKEKTIIKKIK